MTESDGELGWRVETVSGWSIAEHLEHLLLTDATILRQIRDLDPEVLQRGKPKPRFWGWVVLLAGFRQRGVAKSPPQVVPRDPTPERLRELGATVGGLLSEVEAMPEEVDLARWTYPHPLLGRFSAQQWLRFMAVHHQHHHRIIADIRRAHAST